MIRISGKQSIRESKPHYDDIDSLIVFTLWDNKEEQKIETKQGYDRDDMCWTLVCLQYLCNEVDEEIHIEERQLHYISDRSFQNEAEKMELFLEKDYPKHFKILQIIKNEEYINKKTFGFRSFHQHKYKVDEYVVTFGSTLLKNIEFSILYNVNTKQFHSFNIDTFGEAIFSLYDFPNGDRHEKYETWIKQNNYQWIHEEFVAFAKPIVRLQSLFIKENANEKEL